VGSEAIGVADLGKILRELGEGCGPSIMLLFGDDFRVREASKAILNVLAPDSNKTANAERYDGRTCAWDQVEAALMTPSLFAATHTVVVNDAPYFAPPQRKQNLLEKALEMCSEGHNGARRKSRPRRADWLETTEWTLRT